MGTPIRLKSPGGVTKVVDPDTFDVPKALKMGFTRAGSVMVAAHSRAAPTRRQQEQFTPAELASSGATQPAYVPDPVPEPGVVGAIPSATGALGGALGFAAGGGADALLTALTGGAAAPTIPAAAIGGGGMGAMAGGTVGQALRLAIDHALGVNTPETPTNPAEVAGSLAKEGGLQGAYQLAGEPVAAGAKALGSATMGAALRATPEAAQTAIREGITATGAGVKKIVTKLGEYGARTLAMVRQNHQMFDPTDILNGGGQALVAEIAGNQTGQAPARWQVYRKLAQDFVDRHTDNNGAIRPLSAVQLQKFKQQAQDIAEPIFKRIAMKEQVSADEAATATWYKAMADHAQQVLENTTPDMIDPRTGKTMSLAQSNAQTGSLIQLKDILAPDTREQMSVGAQIAKRAVPSAGGAVVGGTAGALADRTGNKRGAAATGATAGALLMNSPQALSQIALLLNNPMIAGLLAQAPRTVGAVVGQ